MRGKVARRKEQEKRQWRCSCRVLRLLNWTPNTHAEGLQPSTIPLLPLHQIGLGEVHIPSRQAEACPRNRPDLTDSSQTMELCQGVLGKVEQGQGSGVRSARGSRRSVDSVGSAKKRHERIASKYNFFSTKARDIKSIFGTMTYSLLLVPHDALSNQSDLHLCMRWMKPCCREIVKSSERISHDQQEDSKSRNPNTGETPRKRLVMRQHSGESLEWKMGADDKRKGDPIAPRRSYPHVPKISLKDGSSSRMSQTSDGELQHSLLRGRETVMKIPRPSPRRSPPSEENQAALTPTHGGSKRSLRRTGSRTPRPLIRDHRGPQIDEIAFKESTSSSSPRSARAEIEAAAERKLKQMLTILERNWEESRRAD
ncbi:hypothetical protein GUITHDRAFT_108118 [Guillardia theta CCMP2712]|uniref:Uncharacterized protein n=1 Tax=Guillardia theta (strain CCMP2712) TaxID=905079 RepID=L1JCM9_GUITC|nr:hypothetical protein GUITHDRAFT_108118 [Guillardia theta CCMP2712]EKX46082.1 hypothetical protein GUITHDRAFT_108118 [Guillardia theta CCMP2712]|eukprot:XP_005833062.1 hypothetical protein GUITHDRAFT_108118 [Guillardia theta CCMP2712]